MSIHSGRAVSPPANPRLTRRRAAALVALPFAWSSAPRIAWGQQHTLTPSQTEGPYYPTQLPADIDADLLRNGQREYRKGQVAWVGGLVTDPDGRPLAGADVEIWQCDATGRYHHPGDGNRADPDFQGFGRARLDANGRYRFRTLRPVAYGGRTPHIHVKVKLGTRELLTTQLYVEGDPGNARDFLWRRLNPQQRALLTVAFRPGVNGQLGAEFPMVVVA